MRKRLKDLYTAVLSDAEYLQELVELGVLIGSHRTALGINQEEFAKMIGVSWRTMTKIENGRQSLSFVVFLRIAAVLEMRPEYLLQELARVTQRKWSRKEEDLGRVGRSCRNGKGCIQENIVINNLILRFTIIEDYFI